MHEVISPLAVLAVVLATCSRRRVLTVVMAGGVFSAAQAQPRVDAATFSTAAAVAPGRIGSGEGVLCGVLVAERAMGFSCLPQADDVRPMSAEPISLIGYWLEVGWIHTRRVPTEMIQAKPLRDRSDQRFIRETVRQGHDPYFPRFVPFDIIAPVSHSVSIGRPFPTSRRTGDNFLAESSGQLGDLGCHVRNMAHQFTGGKAR